MGIVPIIGLIFWLADSTGDINETINGCSTWGWGSCPPKPPGYDMPRTIMLFYLVILGIYALSKTILKKTKHVDMALHTVWDLAILSTF